MKTLTTFRQILDNPQLNDTERTEQIRSLGIFVITPLLNEIDTSSSTISAESLEACLWGIIEDFCGEDMDQNLDRWRSKNEQTFRDMIEILE